MAQDSVRHPSANTPTTTTTGAPIATAPGSSAEARGGIEEVQASAEFRELRRRYRRFAFPMTLAFLAWYLLYVIASGFFRDFMGQHVIGFINVAIIFGLLQFASTFGIAISYTWYANRRLDPLGEKLRREMLP